MKLDLVLMILLAATAAPAQEPQPEANVNERYTVESVELAPDLEPKLSQALRDDLQKMAGEKFSQKTYDELLERVRQELPRRTVTGTIARGNKPEHVKITIEAAKRKEDAADLRLSRFLYHAKQGWSVKVVGSFELEAPNEVILGLVSDADDLLERHAGIVAGFENGRLVTDRLRLRFLFQTYHNQWNRATQTALDASPEVPGIYRTRRSFEPLLIAVPAPGVTLSGGVSFQFIQTQFPTARTEAANAAVGEIRYHGRFRDAQGNRHDLEAGYNLRAAARTLESDFVYTRHQWNLGYRLGGRRQALGANFRAGRVSGRAPLFERFTLGNSNTLRGWNKFDVAPLGGNRMVHNTLEYRHSSFQVFYDAGAVWDRGARAVARHAAGLGFYDDREGKSLLLPGFFLTLGFPIKTGRAAPIFMIGVNF